MIERPVLPPVPRIGSMFSGVGGLCEFAVAPELGGKVVWHAENDAAAAAVLARCWPDTPNLGDVAAVDWTTVEPVDALTLGFPCQDVSEAGLGAGLTAGNRSGMWFHGAHAIRVLRPRLVVIENVRGLLSAKAGGALESCPLCLGDRPDRVLRALGAVLGNLADLGYDAEWLGVPASDLGAAHRRFRLFVIAWPAADGSCPRRQGSGPQPARGRSRACHRAVADSAFVVQHRPEQPRRGRSGSADHDLPPVEWGPYAAAVERWERVLGRGAPAPTEPGKRTEQVLSARLVEWLMGYPEGHVTGIDMPRTALFRLLGNGVVPHQARAALRVLLARGDGDHAERDTAMSVRITL